MIKSILVFAFLLSITPLLMSNSKLINKKRALEIFTSFRSPMFVEVAASINPITHVSVVDLGKASGNGNRAETSARESTQTNATIINETLPKNAEEVDEKPSLRPRSEGEGEVKETNETGEAKIIKSSIDGLSFPTLPPLPEMPTYCKERTQYLKTFTNDVSLPLLVDVIAHLDKSHMILINIFFNTAHLGPKAAEEKHTNFTLLYEGIRYSNRFTGSINWNTYLMVRFSLPAASTISHNDAIVFTLLDEKFNRKYKDIQTCVQTYDNHDLDLLLCAYLSPYNTIPEIVSWIAYYRLQHVSKIVFYLGEPYPAAKQHLLPLIEAGYIEWVDWSWPTTGILSRPQRENQQAQIMSCYYRYRAQAKFITLCDVDEYIHPQNTEYGIDEKVKAIFGQYSNYNVITMNSYFFTNRENKWSNKDELIKDGSFFKTNIRKISKEESGRRKMIIQTRFNGALSVHTSLWGRELMLESDYLSIAHYKSNMFRRMAEDDKSMGEYADAIVKEMKLLDTQLFE